MKNLTYIANQERIKTRKDVFWLLEIFLPGGKRNFCFRPLTLGEEEYKPELLRIGKLLRRIEKGELVGESVLEAEIRNAFEQGESRIQILHETFDIRGSRANLYIFFRDSEGNAVLDDRIELGEFKIFRTEFTGETGILFMKDPINYHGGKDFLRKAETSLVPGYEEESGELYFPVILGKKQDCPLVLLPFFKAINWSSELTRELAPEHSFCELGDVRGLPDKGRLQLGGELMEYRAVDREKGYVGTDASPLVRPEAGYHPDGTQARFIPSEGLYFLVGDHPCLGVTELRAGGRDVNPGEASVVSRNLGDREVCMVHLERFPSFVQNTSGSSFVRFAGEYSDSSWEVDEQTTGLFAKRCVDSFPGITGAQLDAEHPEIVLEFNENLSNGGNRYGSFVSARIDVSYFSPGKGGNFPSVEVLAQKAENQESLNLAWSPRECLTAVLNEQSLQLLEEGNPEGSGSTVPENILIKEFDLAFGTEELEGGNYKWKDANLAKDGDFETFTESFSGPGIDSNPDPLIFRIKRKPMLDLAATPTRFLFHAVMDSKGTAQKDVRLGMRLANQFNGEGFFRVDGQKREYVYEVPVSGIGFEHLIDSVTEFCVNVPDGSALRVYEAWLEVFYKLETGEFSTGGAAGDIEGLLQSLEIDLPSPQLRQTMDLTSMAKENGGWEFFKQQGGALQLTIRFSGGEAPVFITDIGMTVEYRPIAKTVMETELTATVEGIYEQGELLDNPVDMVRHILTDKNYLDFSPDKIDDISFEQAKLLFCNAGDSDSFYFSRDVTITEALEEVLTSCNLRLMHEGGLCRILPQKWEPWKLGETLKTDIEANQDIVLNTEITVREKRTDPDTRSIEILSPLELIHAEPGDRAVLNHEFAGIEQGWGELGSIEIETPDQLKLEISNPELGPIFWEHDANTLSRIVSRGRHMVFYFEGRAVARLEKGGRLCLWGEVWEEALEGGTISAPLEYSETEKRLLFGAGSGDEFEVIFALDENGNLLTRGEVSEGGVPSGLETMDFYGCASLGEEQCLGLSLDKENPLLVAERTTKKIYIKTEIVENTT